MSLTVLLILLTVVISFLGWQFKGLTIRLIFAPKAISSLGEWYRFVTYGFLHADLWHLLFNMITLYFFGRWVEQFYNQFFGGFGFLVFYILALVMSILPSYIKHKNDVHFFSLGASGAVLAVIFVFILFNPWQKLYIMGILPIPAIVFAILYIGYSVFVMNWGKVGNINHSAHLAGALFGFLLTALLRPEVLYHFGYQLLHPTF